jgi:3-dehydroquinate synthase
VPSTLLLRYAPHRAASRVRVARGGLAQLGSEVRRTTGARRAVMVSDPIVAALWAGAAARSLARAGVACDLVVVPAGERSKSARQLAALWQGFGRLGIGRGDTVVALGGGVVGDLAGFAAATWLRGVAWVAAPTSLLAQVDSSVGGKTAIDLASGKNLAGAFHQPRAVVVDPDVLGTLPERHLRAGLAEVAKMGMAVDAALFRRLEVRSDLALARDLDALEDLVVRSIRAKARIVLGDEREREGGRRTALNYGHTLAHALEACLGYRRWLHGEAVAVGMRVAGVLSRDVAGLPESDRARQDALLDRLGLPARIPRLAAGDLLAAMSGDKKARNGRIRWVLTPRMGHASVPRLIPGRRVEAALLEAGARA